MPVTSDDLWLINAGTAESAKLDQALDYIQTAMPIAGGDSITEFLTKRDIKIEFNDRGEINYNPSTKTINWDPDKGGKFVTTRAISSASIPPHLPCSTKSITHWTRISQRPHSVRMLSRSPIQNATLFSAQTKR